MRRKNEIKPKIKLVALKFKMETYWNARETLISV